MDTANDAAQSGGAASDIVQVPPPAAAEVSARDAARSVVNFRLKAREEGGQAPAEDRPVEETKPPASAAEEPQEKEASADANDAAAPAPAPTPIEPPKSWSEEARERFQTLPRETQEFLTRQESERDGETAAHRSALDAERAKAELARVNYEQALPSLAAALQQQVAADFPDVRSAGDLERLAREDWPRYLQWDAQQKRIAQAQQQAQETALRRELEHQAGFQNLVQHEQALLIEKNPELADPVQRARLTQSATDMLYELGFSAAELGDFFHGRRQLNLHDHRLQMLIRDGVRFREAQKAARQATARPMPPVQRPGAAQPKGAAHEAAVQNLARRLDQSGSLKDAARLLAERRKAAR
jgi:hypothetical protein